MKMQSLNLKFWFILTGILFVAMVLQGYPQPLKPTPPVPPEPLTRLISEDSMNSISLEGKWKFQTDPDDTGLSKKWFETKFNDTAWGEIDVPSFWESCGITTANPYWKEDDMNTPYSGYAWYRNKVVIPGEWIKDTVYLVLGRIDDYDWTFFNGEQIGHIGKEDAMADVKLRYYAVPTTLIQYGKENQIAVRVCDVRGDGGIHIGPVKLVYGKNKLDELIEEASYSRGDYVRTGQNIHIKSGETIRGNVVAINGSIIIDGRVLGDVVSIGGNVTVKENAFVRGDAVCIGGKLDIHPQAIVQGSTVSIGPNIISEKIISLLQGDKSVKHNHDSGLGFLTVIYIIGLFFIVIGFCIGLVITALVPERVQRVADTVIKTPGKSFGIGCLMYILLIPITLVLIISCIGIPFVPVGWIIFKIAKYMGYAAIGLILGTKLAKNFKWNIKSVFGLTCLGLLLISLIRLIPLLGYMIYLILVVAGLGAVIITKFGKQEMGQSGSTVPPIPPVPPTPAPIMPSKDSGSTPSSNPPNPPAT